MKEMIFFLFVSIAIEGLSQNSLFISKLLNNKFSIIKKTTYEIFKINWSIDVVFQPYIIRLVLWGQ
jgi:hypothetical protein